MNIFIKIFLLNLVFIPYLVLCQNNNLDSMVSQAQWNSMFPKRAGTYGSHPQGYTNDFFSYNNLKQAVSEMSDYRVVIRKKNRSLG